MDKEQQEQINLLNLQISEKEKRLNKLLLLVKEEKELDNQKLNKLKELLKEQNEKFENLNNNINQFNQEKFKLENELKDNIIKNQNIDSQIIKYLSSSSSSSNENNNNNNNNDNDNLIIERIEYYKLKQLGLQNKLNNLNNDFKEEELLKNKFLNLSSTEKKLSDKIATTN